MTISIIHTLTLFIMKSIRWIIFSWKRKGLRISEKEINEEEIYKAVEEVFFIDNSINKNEGKKFYKNLRNDIQKIPERSEGGEEKIEEKIFRKNNLENIK